MLKKGISFFKRKIRKKKKKGPTRVGPYIFLENAAGRKICLTCDPNNQTWKKYEAQSLSNQTMKDKIRKNTKGF